MTRKVLANTSGGPLVALALALVVAASATITAQTTTAAGTPLPQPLSSKAFTDRVNAYLALQKKLQEGLPPLKPTEQPTRIEVHERGLADRIRDARANAKMGDIFGETADAIRHAIKEDAERRSVRDAFAAMKEVPVKAPPALNGDYPETAPLATVPPLLLLRLPRLPDGVEYRFLGRDLVLRDMKANLIVDIVREAVPTIGR